MTDDQIKNWERLLGGNLSEHDKNRLKDAELSDIIGYWTVSGYVKIEKSEIEKLKEQVEALEKENKMWRKKIVQFAVIAIDELNCSKCKANRTMAIVEAEELTQGLTRCCGANRNYEPLDGHHYCEDCGTLA